MPNSSNKSPLVSIIIPYFNREEFLAEAIESVLKQTYQNWELFLIDDGSTDSSNKIAEEYACKFNRQIFSLQHPDGQNKGASAARRVGFDRAKGEFITFLDSDDVYFPNTIENELNWFSQNPEADVVCGLIECWYSWSKDATYFEKDFVIDPLLPLNKLYDPPELLIHNLEVGGRKPGINCIMLKSDFARRIEIFWENPRYSWEDQVFWAKVSLNGKIYLNDGVLAKYRQHPASTCTNSINSGQDLQTIELFLDWLKKYLTEQNANDGDLWNCLDKFERNIERRNKHQKLLQIYRKILPLSARYFLRDKLSTVKKYFR